MFFFNMLKLILLGDTNVGKSTLLNQLCNKMETQKTVGVSIRIVSVHMEDVVHTIRFVDTSGLRCYESLLHDYILNSDACVIVYDITREYTFRRALQILSQIEKPCILVGNKLDMVPYRRISQSEVFKMLKKQELDHVHVTETSSLLGTNCKLLLQIIIRQITVSKETVVLKSSKRVEQCSIV